MRPRPEGLRLVQTTARPTWIGVRSGPIVLIVADEDGIRDFLRSAFEVEGYTVLAAADGEAALVLCQHYQPDAILLDLHLPDLQGDEVLRQLQADPLTARIPVVVLSADATARQIDRLLAAGAHAYLTKPLDVRRFLDVMDGAFTQRAPAGGD